MPGEKALLEVKYYLRNGNLAENSWKVEISKEVMDKALARSIDLSIVLERALSDLTRKQKLSELYENEFNHADNQRRKLIVKCEFWNEKVDLARDKWTGQLERETKEAEEAKLKKRKEAGK